MKPEALYCTEVLSELFLSILRRSVLLIAVFDIYEAEVQFQWQKQF